MDIFDGEIPFRQFIFLAEPQGQFLPDAALHLGKGFFHQIAEHFLGKALGSGIDGNDAATGEVFTDALHFGRQNLFSAVFFLKLPGKKIPFADFQAVFHIGLIIPEDAHGACFIIDLHAGIDQPAVAAILPFFLHLGQKGGGFLHGQVGNFQNLASILIFSGVMGQQVFNGADAQFLQLSFSLFPDAFQLGYGTVPIHGVRLLSFA